MSILARIRAHGGEVTRDKWRFTVRPGKLSKEAQQWIRDHHLEMKSEAWSRFDEWDERAARLEFSNGMSREEAEAQAYQDILKTEPIVC